VGAREDGTKELDRLFTRLDKSPWGDRNKKNQLSDESTAIAEALGIDIADEPTRTDDTVNGNFDAGPSDDSAIIDADDNGLPGWDYTEVQGTWSVTWDADAAAPGGYAINATQSSSSASDEFYLEQTFPATHYRRFVVTARHASDNSNTGFKIAVAFLDEEGNVIGSELTNTWSITTAQTSRFWREPPNLAYEVRVRVGFVNAAGNTGETGTIYFVSTEEPTVYDVAFPGVYSFLSPAASNDYMMPYPSDVIPNGVFQPDTEGFVLGVSILTDDTISAGTITARVENDTQATTPGPSAALSSGTTEATARQSLDGVASDSYDFAAGDNLHLELSADGSFTSTGSADYYGHARLLLVVNDHGDWA
jgi:hypothetical protein